MHKPYFGLISHFKVLMGQVRYLIVLIPDLCPYAFLTMYVCQFGQNQPTGSEDSVWKWLIFSLCKMVTLKIRIKVTKI